MQAWQEDLLRALETSRCEGDVFEHLQTVAQTLGFEFCAYGLQLPLPLARPQTLMLNNYPAAWHTRYIQANYQLVDPSVVHCRHSRAPVVWSDALFAKTPSFWEEAQSFGLRHGWAQAIFDVRGVAGMLTLARQTPPISALERQHKEFRWSWLASMAHMGLARYLVPKHAPRPKATLTTREVEVMKWAADGKTSSEIADILCLSENTIKFHTKNAIAKLEMPNKTAAVVCAAMLGLLH